MNITNTPEVTIKSSNLKYAVYITSDDRSGSTMLDLLLANHPSIFCIGEVHNLAAYLHNDRSFYNPVHELICMCGSPIGKCNFWKQVERELGRPLQSLRIRSDRVCYNAFCRIMNRIHCRIEKEILQHSPELLERKIIRRLIHHDKFAEDTFAFYEAVSAASGAPIITDSSKWPFRFHYLYENSPEKIKIIKLFRHPFAVVCSKVRRKEGNIIECAEQWANMVDNINLFTRNVPESCQLQIHYEELCNDTPKTINKICQFLGIPYNQMVLSLKKDRIHHIGGSPSKFKRGDTTISLDERYKDELTSTQLKKISHVLRRFRNIYPDL